MNLNESYGELNRLDKPEFIEELNFFGHNFWPLFRFHLLLKFKSPEEYFSSAPKATAPAPKHFFARIKDGYSFRKNLRRQFSALDDLRLGSTLFVSDKSYYTDSVKGKAYNRHTDPCITLLREAGYTCTKLRVSDTGPDPAQYYHRPEIEFNRFFYFSVFPYNYQGDDFKNIVFRLESACAREKVQVNIPVLARHIYRIVHMASLYEKILLKIKPRAIFLPCFYEPEKFALLLAAKKMKIPVVDIQHGKQGVKHHLYYGWNYVPSKGYDLLPDFFWNWGEPSARMIRENFHAEQKPECIAGGNAWLSLWTNNKIDAWTGSMPMENASFRKKILMALQPVATDVFVNFITALARLRPDFLIMLRLHPVMQKDKAIFQALADQYTNIEIDISSVAPLYSLLRYADACVTAWSSVIVESRYFNVPGYLMHETGAQVFQEDIAAGKMFYSPTAETFVQHLLEKPLAVKDDFIMTDEKWILEKLKMICDL